MADLVLQSLRGGMNNTDPAIGLPDHQCVTAQNVEWRASMLGERRRGSDGIDLSGSDLVTADRIVWIFRHLPTKDEADAQLWVMGIVSGAAVLAYKDTSWHTVTMDDAPTVDGVSEYHVRGQTLHGKLYIAYNSAVDRLHVYNTTTLRRVGLAEADAPVVIDNGSGSFSGARYYRVRWIKMSGTVVQLRGEPSEVTTFTPSGTGSGALVAKPAAISESETHWELEASLDNSNFYRIATVAEATVSYTDTTTYTVGYSAFTLSEGVGDYTLIPSAKYLAADEDRLIFGGSWEDDDAASQVGWTPVFNADGVGNDERMEADTDPTLNLDGYEGGELTGLAKPTTGSVWAFKAAHIYKLIRRNQRTRAYEVAVITKTRGALQGSITEGIDQAGSPALFFLDPMVGPNIIGTGGLRTCGSDILTTWLTVNRDATVAARALFYPDARQVHWWVPTDDSDTPDTRLVLHTNLMRDGVDGVRGGWAVWDGPSCEALTACLFAEDIDDDNARSRVLKPFIGLSGTDLIQRTDQGDDDGGTAYTALIVTKPYASGNLLHAFAVTEGRVMATAAADVTLTISLTRDFGLETIDVTGISLTPTGSETQVVKHLDNLRLSELRTMQARFTDSASPTGRWELNHLCLMARGEQRAG